MNADKANKANNADKAPQHANRPTPSDMKDGMKADTKEHRYDELTKEIQALTHGETDAICIMANVAAAINAAFGFLWTGFYRVVGSQLVLGPFQGPVACQRIAFGRGVCGAAWERREAVVVPDVRSFPGHIACNAASKSEIVVPVIVRGEVVAVLDIDSSEPARFDSCDRTGLQRIASHIAKCLENAQP